jgi:hypothetical protein
MTKSSQTAVTEEETSNNSEIITTPAEIQRKIAALKLHPAPAQTKSQLFHYDPNEPLHIPPKTRKNF